MGRPTRKVGNPEHKLQCAIADYLDAALLGTGVVWTANCAGGKASQFRANQMKAAGLKRGWPDLQALLPNGQVVFIEIKTATGSLSPEQRSFRDKCQATGCDIWALARSVEDVAAAFTRWGVRLRSHPFFLIDQEALNAA